MPMPRLASATATAPLPMPIEPGVIGKAEATSSAGRIRSAASTGCGMSSAAATAIVAPRRASTMAADQPSTVASARGERSSADEAGEHLGDPRVAAQAARERGGHGERGDDPAQRERGPERHRARSRTRRRAARRASASGPRRAPRRPRRRSRCARVRRSPFEKSAIFTASPSLAGANELTIAPTPRLAAARLGQIAAAGGAERGTPGADGAARTQPRTRPPRPEASAARRRATTRRPRRRARRAAAATRQRPGAGRGPPRRREASVREMIIEWAFVRMDPEASRRVSAETVKIRIGMLHHALFIGRRRTSMRGAVAAGHPLTAAAGARVLEEGGNAVDACVAAAFAAWVAESPLTGPGAGGFALVVPVGRAPGPGGRLLRLHSGDRPRRRRRGGDACDRRRLRRRQRDDAGLPDRRGVLRRARGGRGARGRPPRATAACRGGSCSSPRSSSPGPASRSRGRRRTCTRSST